MIAWRVGHSGRISRACQTARVRPISRLRSSLLRFVDFRFPENSLRTWEIYPLIEDSAWVLPSEIQNLSTEIGRRTGCLRCISRLGLPWGDLLFKRDPSKNKICVFHTACMISRALASASERSRSSTDPFSSESTTSRHWPSAARLSSHRDF